jgi:hypothetical protein
MRGKWRFWDRGASRHLAHNQHTESLKTSGKLRIPTDWQSVGAGQVRSVIEYAGRVLVACRSEFVTADAAGGVRVLPLDGPSIGGVGVDIAAELAS